MRVKSYLRGLGLGLIVGALVMGGTKAGPSVSDAQPQDTRENSDGRTLAEIADSNLKESGDDSDESSKQEDNSEHNEDSNQPEEPIQEAKADQQGDSKQGEDPNQTKDTKTEESSKQEEASNTDKSSQESSSNSEDDTKKPDSQPKTDTEAAAQVGAGLPLSERIDAFSNGEDAPGTRTARGEGSTGSSTGSSASGSGSGSSANGSGSGSSTSSSGSMANGSGSNKTDSGNTSSKEEQAKTDNSQTNKDTQGTSVSGGSTGNVTVSKTYTVSVYPGEGSYTVSRKLAELGLVESAQVYDTFLCQNGYDKKIRTGNYDIAAGSTPEQIARIITTGK